MSAWSRLPDPEILARAVDAVTERHPMFRSVYADTEHGPRRRVLPPGETGRLTVREVPGADDEELRRMVDAEVAAPFRLTDEGPFRAVLLRREADAVALVVTHHIATDALSQWLLWRDLLAAYADLADGREPRLEPPATDFDHFVAAERTLLDSSRGARQADFWRAQRAGSAGRRTPHRPAPSGRTGEQGHEPGAQAARRALGGYPARRPTARSPSSRWRSARSRRW